MFTPEMAYEVDYLRKNVTRRVSDRWARVRPGTRLWVREAWAALDVLGRWIDRPGKNQARVRERVYKANHRVEDWPTVEDWARAAPPRWTPAVHLPRWACRMVLEVTSVRREAGCRDGVELPEVDDAEARREGTLSRAHYLALWARINGKKPVPEHLWRIEFRLVGEIAGDES